jgi:hypothetical protein
MSAHRVKEGQYPLEVSEIAVNMKPENGMFCVDTAKCYVRHRMKNGVDHFKVQGGR